MLLWSSGCTWREERRHGDKDVDRGCFDVDEGVLLADPRFHFAIAIVVVCVSVSGLVVSCYAPNRVGGGFDSSPS